MSEERAELQRDDEVAALLERLRSLLARRGQEVRSQYDRSLPFADYVVDRWKKAEQLGFGHGSSVYDSCLILGDVRVGSDTWIGPFTVLDGTGGLEIGSHCSISASVHIYSHDTVRRDTSGGVEPIEYGRVIIGSNCYIGPHTVVSRGVRIGDGSVIGAHSLVNRDVPPGARAWGVPCRVQGDASAG